MTTNPELNEQIKHLLKLGGQYEHYALERIIELEQQVLEQKNEIEELTKSSDVSEENSHLYKERAERYEDALIEIANSPYGLREVMVKIAKEALGLKTKE
jgi:uncharacterized coiled-coil protein SlyX